jgi:hypothetical protein
MPKTKIILLGLFTILVTLSSAQDDFIERPVTFSFFPPVSTNGMEFWKVRTRFSLSIIGGAVGQLDGAEFASVFSIEKDMARGFQASGAFNLIGSSFEGAQMAGGVNIVGEMVNGLQMAGGVNIVGENFEGVQMAGGVNIVGEKAKGVQIAGGVNIIGKEGEGAQIAPVNIANSVKGCQIGVVNIADRVKGFQLGVVNIADNLDGEALGIVSIVGNGQFHINAWADEVAPINLGFKLGTKRIYNLYGLGMKSSGDSTYMIVTGGLGWHLPLNQFFMNFEVMYGSIRRGFSFREWENTRLSRLRVIGGWQVIPKLAITAGPTINVYVSEDRGGSDLPMFDATIYSKDADDPDDWYVRIWPGFTVGIQIF